MISKTVKNSEAIKKQMVSWFLKYHRRDEDQFNGTEQFTLFDKLSPDKQKQYLGRFESVGDERPVFLLVINDKEQIINTTSRFVRLHKSSCEIIPYTQFESHTGFKSIVVNQDQTTGRTSVKTAGFVSEFGLKTRNGTLVYWNVPTGEAGFSFWNVTKKCDLIGRKYMNESDNTET